VKIIYKPRGAGKTTELIKIASNGEHKQIVCRTSSVADQIWQTILKMKEDDEIKCLPPKPISYLQFLNKEYRGKNIESFLIDDVDIFLHCLTDIRIEAISVTKND